MSPVQYQLYIQMTKINTRIVNASFFKFKSQDRALNLQNIA